jgi:hypothetical protein
VQSEMGVSPENGGVGYWSGRCSRRLTNGRERESTREGGAYAWAAGG